MSACVSSKRNDCVKEVLMRLTTASTVPASAPEPAPVGLTGLGMLAAVFLTHKFEEGQSNLQGHTPQTSLANHGRIGVELERHLA